MTNDDPSLVVHILSAPPDADPFDPETIRAVNPAFGKFLDEADVMNEAERARRMPSFESAFRNLRLNQRIAPHARDQLLTPEVWATGNEPIDEAMFCDGRPVFGGLDLSSTVDLTALVLAAEDDARQRASAAAGLDAGRYLDRAQPERPRALRRLGARRLYDGGARQGHRLRLGGDRAGRCGRPHEPAPGQL